MTRSYIFAGKSEMSAVQIDMRALKSAFDEYETSFNKYLSEYVVQGTDNLVEELKKLTEKLGTCKLSNWDRNVKSIISKIAAGVFATFSIIKSGKAFVNFSENNQGTKAKTRIEIADLIFKSHNIQIFAIFRWIGFGVEEKVLSNQIM